MIEHLFGMEDGWLDGEGVAPSEEGLRWLKGVYERFAGQVPQPYSYPTPEGGVQAEWSTTRWELTVTFDLQKRQAKMVATSIHSDLFFEQAFDLSTEEGEKEFIDNLNKSFDVIAKVDHPL